MSNASRTRTRRRDFLKTVAGSSAALAAASTLPAPAIASDTIRWRMVTTWPKGFPGLGAGAAHLADLINRTSGGRLQVTVYGAGELVPAFEAMDAVANGTADLGHGGPYYWKGKAEATQFLSAVPFGFTVQEQNAWYEFGGGQELADKIYRGFGCKFFSAGNTTAQMGGWFNVEISSIDDLKGLKMRIPGLGGEVMRSAGVNVVNIPGGALFTSIKSGAIDALEWVGPYNDLAFGLYQGADYYYYPGWHEPAACIDCFINLERWEELPNDLQEIVAACCRAANGTMVSEFTARNNAALNVLTSRHGVQLRHFPDEVLQELARLTKEVTGDIRSRDAMSDEVLTSIEAFLKAASAWSNLSNKSYLDVRSKMISPAG